MRFKRGEVKLVLNMTQEEKMRLAGLDTATTFTRSSPFKCSHLGLDA